MILVTRNQGQAVMLIRKRKAEKENFNSCSVFGSPRVYCIPRLFEDSKEVHNISEWHSMVQEHLHWLHSLIPVLDPIPHEPHLN